MKNLVLTFPSLWESQGAGSLGHSAVHGTHVTPKLGFLSSNSGDFLIPEDAVVHTMKGSGSPGDRALPWLV